MKIESGAILKGWLQMLKENSNEENKIDFFQKPGLRVVGVDLGHRNQAACSVIETCAKKNKMGRYRQIRFNEAEAPHVRIERKVILKLQGEDQTRKAYPEEKQLLEDLCQTFDLNGDFSDDKNVMDTMTSALYLMKKALYRHSDIAYVAYAIDSKNPNEKTNVLKKLENLNLGSHSKEFYAILWEKQGRVVLHMLNRVIKFVYPYEKAQNLGGLSLQRISVLISLKKLIQVFLDRRTPTDIMFGRNRKLSKDERKLATMLRRLDRAVEMRRRDRAKQVAAHIVNVAMGNGGQYAPCHMIVIEDLTNYKQSKRYTRRENRGLANWTASRVKDWLQQMCSEMGIKLMMVSPADTSQINAYTGETGYRCVQMQVKKFLSFYKNKIDKIRKYKDNTSEYIVEMYDYWIKVPIENIKDHDNVFIPNYAGEVFVSGYTKINADMNASINIALKPLLDGEYYNLYKDDEVSGKLLIRHPYNSEEFITRPEWNNIRKTMVINVLKRKFTRTYKVSS